MSFGQKPWGQAQRAPQPQQLNPSLFTNQLGLATGQAFSGLSAGMGINQGLLVNQAAFTNMNMNNVLAQAQRQMQLPPQHHVPQPQQQRTVVPAPATSPGRNQRTFVGTVTKLMETYGFVDEDVFFQTNVIRGAIPRVGDRVMVDATFNPSMPFKWNARSIEKIQESAAPQQQQQYQQHQHQTRQPHQQQNGSSGGSRWGDRIIREEPRRQQTSMRRSPSPKPARRPASRQRSPVQRRERSPVARRQEQAGVKRDREERVAESRERDSTRGRGSPASKREDSPPRRRQRIIPRYHCNVPKQSIQSSELKQVDLRRRYPSLYIPSDFIRCKFDWIDSIKLENPVAFSPHPIIFHVLHKDVDVPLANGEELPPIYPPDADNRFVVKVLLIAHPGMSSLRKKISGLLPDGSIDETVDTQTITKNLQLLVGHRGKGELMGIGGAWSPSLDGANPLDPQTLVRTAIRTTRALTGLDLSNCARWYKMAQLRYFRVERSRIDSCILMLPDTGACVDFQPPSDEQFAVQVQALRDQLAAKLAAIDAEQFCSLVEKDGDGQPTDGSGRTAEVAASGENVVDGAQPENVEKAPEQQAKDGTTADTAAKTSSAEGVEPTESMEVTGEPQQPPIASVVSTKKDGMTTHWSVLGQNVKALKVAELRDELEARKLDAKGVKNVLMQRLQEAIERERAADIAAGTTGQHAAEPQQAANETEASTEAEKGPEQAKEQSPVATEKQSIVVQIKEEMVELMETDEVGEKSDEAEKETAEEKAARERAEKERQELENAKEQFEKAKKERKAMLERHYGQLPSEPGIFVYPSKTARQGKFDCKLMTLHALLEYNKEHDNKESSFEVFLFSEMLKEALDRSNAFVVYHAISTALDKDAEKKRRNETLAEASKDDEVVVIEEGKKDEEKAEKSKSPTQNVDLRTNFKALVHDFEKFSAFVHFDSNVCGYIIERDLEDIIYSTGLDLSRGDVQRLVKKLASKDRIYYRDFTDKLVDKEGNVKYTPEPACENLIDSYAEHAKGHDPLLQEAIASVRINGTESNASTETQNVNDYGIVFYKGTLVNIKQSLEAQSALEKDRQNVIDKNEQLELQLASVREQRETLEKKKRRLEDDVDRYKKKLYETEKNLKKEQEDNATMKSALQDCKRYGEKITGIVEKLFPPPKKEEKSKKEGDNEEILILEEKIEKEPTKVSLSVEVLMAALEEGSKKKSSEGRNIREKSV